MTSESGERFPAEDGPGAGARRPNGASSAFRTGAAPVRGDGAHLAPVLALGLALGLAAAPRPRFPDRPPPAHTGGFGEPTCLECHFGGPPNEPAGALTLAGIPEAYRPGQRYRVVLTLVRPRMLRGGFEVAVRYADGDLAGRQAGTLRPLDDLTAVTAHGDPAIAYAHHTADGTALAAPDTVRWLVEWTAPAAGGGRVVFHAAANAADDDGSPFGDWIYTASAGSGPKE